MSLPTIGSGLDSDFDFGFDAPTQSVNESHSPVRRQERLRFIVSVQLAMTPQILEHEALAQQSGRIVRHLTQQGLGGRKDLACRG